ncbi:hypothetical protein KIMH_06260 [Bombiscardovia apis]|uniref:Uncharacterized protein n=1 Tax=Bombiscardovia apis TaxID=2932182 RepID=A0ABM8BC99_9BIFI|nr:hypothetical protein [Bombiscardovia apis]BDR54515.1 hypothetical protein KIMH_06260 [Bombiscardovia apis]
MGLTSCSSGKGNDAHNSANYQKLKDFYEQAEKYGPADIKSLENGRYRFYGEMQGARLV